MSHFTVLVIGENPEDQLKPFKEYDGEDWLKPYLEFKETDPEEMEKYENDTVSVFIDKQGYKHDKYDDGFKVKVKDGRPFETNKYLCPEGWTEAEIPNKEFYETFEDFVNRYGEEKPDPVTGKRGYWHNPQGYWDWYQLGGRWTGFYKAKENTPVLVGKMGLGNHPPEKGYLDQGTKGNIDFEGTKHDAGEKARERYQTFKRLMGDNIPKIERSWDDIRMQYSDDIDKARDVYHKQDALVLHKKLVEEARKMPLSREETEIVVWEELEDYQCTEEEYVQRARDNALSTFAVLKDGKWYQKGEMGWWAMVSNEKDQRDWNKEFNDLIDGLADDTLLSVYDCHI